MNVLVAGGSGLVGGLLLEQLAAASDKPLVHALLRRAAPVPAGVRTAVVDFEALDELDATEFAPLDTAFCALGTTRKKAGSAAAFERVDRDYVLAFARLARRAQAKSFVLISSVGADPNAWSHYLKVKGEVEQELASMGFAHLIVLRPSVLVGARAEARLGEALATAVLRVGSPLLRGPLRRYRISPAEQVAQAAILAARAQRPGVWSLEADELAALAAGTN